MSLGIQCSSCFTPWRSMGTQNRSNKANTGRWLNSDGDKVSYSRRTKHSFFQEAAAIVNSTPLWEVSADPNDPQPLSPMMLLTMKNSDFINNSNYTESDIAAYGKRKWRRVQYVADQFWSRWKTFYLQELQTRQKWTRKCRSLEKGDIVLVKDKSAPRRYWPMGIIVSTKLSSDNLVRSVVIKVSNVKTLKQSTSSIVERPITSVVLLLSNHRPEI